MTTFIGLSSIVRSLLVGYPAASQTGDTAILAGEETAPRTHRYLAAASAGVGCVIIALVAVTAGSLVGTLPIGLVASLAGLAIMPTLMDAFKNTMATELALGSLVTASPLTTFGIGSAFWAIAGGYLVSLVTEPPVLRRCLGWL